MVRAVRRAQQGPRFQRDGRVQPRDRAHPEPALPAAAVRHRREHDVPARCDRAASAASTPRSAPAPRPWAPRTPWRSPRCWSPAARSSTSPPRSPTTTTGATYTELEKQLHGYGIGLTAYYCALLAHSPRLLFPLVGLVPTAIRDLRGKDSIRTATMTDFPARLLRQEMKGMLEGVPAFIRSVREQRRKARS